MEKRTVKWMHRRAGSTALVIGVLFIAVEGCVSIPNDGPSSRELSLYENSIHQAAVRSPGWDTPLWPLKEGTTVAVSTFVEDPQLDPRTQDVWVAPSREMWQMCNGKSDVILSLEEILGLPPQRNPGPGHTWHIYVFEVDSSALFRPCPGGLDPRSSPEHPSCRVGAELDPNLTQEQRDFLLRQFWLAHRAMVVEDGNRDFGFPWTGMGWTYNWDPQSATHRGVSEFVVKKSATVRNLKSVTPQEFCGAASPPG